MTENFCLLTKVSNNNVSNGIYITILVLLWAVVAIEILLFVHSLVKLFHTKNTWPVKWWTIPFGFILCGCVLAASILLNEYGIPVEIWTALTVMSGIGILLIFIVLILKACNCAKARKHHMSERKWCMIQQAKLSIKRTLAKIAVKGFKGITQNMSLAQKAAFIGRLTRAIKLLKRNGINPEATKDKLLNDAVRILNNIKNKDYVNFKDFVLKEKDHFLEETGVAGLVANKKAKPTKKAAKKSSKKVNKKKRAK